METHFVLYCSKARKKILMETTIAILTKSVRNNRQEGLTGFLHTDNDHFLQYLERKTKQPRVVLAVWLTLVFLMGNFFVPVIGGVQR